MKEEPILRSVALGPLEGAEGEGVPEIPATFVAKPWWEEAPSSAQKESEPLIQPRPKLKKVAVVTDFYSVDPAYSLTNVVADQLNMLLRHGYSPILLADEFFQCDQRPWNQVPLFKLPSIPRSNRLELPKKWEDHLAKMTESMREGLAPAEVAISHDLIYQPAQILYHMAARAVTQERNGSLHWLHWVHSATPPAVLNSQDIYLQAVKTKFPHAFVVFPNQYSRPRVAKNFGYQEDEVKFVPHPTDYQTFFGFQEITRRLIDAKDMLQAEFIATYPVRLDRGKQVEFCVRIFAQLKKLGRSVRLVIVDFHSTGGDKVSYRRELLNLGQNQGLSGEELIFTSEFDKSLEVSCPREMVRDLMILSNVFILPSRSETYSLVAQEAVLGTCIPVLNFDFPPMRDIYGNEPLFAKFGSNIDAMTGFDGSTDVQYHPDVDAYCHDIAARLIYEMQENRSLRLQTRLRQTRNIDYVFRNYLEPLLYAWG